MFPALHCIALINDDDDDDDKNAYDQYEQLYFYFFPWAVLIHLSWCMLLRSLHCSLLTSGILSNGFGYQILLVRNPNIKQNISKHTVKQCRHADIFNIFSDIDIFMGHQMAQLALVA